MGERQTIRAVNQLLAEELGADALATLSVARQGGHLRVRIPLHRLDLICPCTPSDHRWIKNWRSDLRRQLRYGPRRRDRGPGLPMALA